MPHRVLCGLQRSRKSPIPRPQILVRSLLNWMLVAKKKRRRGHFSTSERKRKKYHDEKVEFFRPYWSWTQSEWPPSTNEQIEMHTNWLAQQKKLRGGRRRLWRCHSSSTENVRVFTRILIVTIFSPSIQSDDDVGILLFQYFHILTIFTCGLVVLRLRPQSFDVILSFILLDFYPPIHSILNKPHYDTYPSK